MRLLCVVKREAITAGRKRSKCWSLWCRGEANGNPSGVGRERRSSNWGGVQAPLLVAKPMIGGTTSGKGIDAVGMIEPREQSSS